MQQVKPRYTVEEYFDIEQMSNVRHEYYDGDMFAMSGGTLKHNQIAQNLGISLMPLRERGCRAYLNDVRVMTLGGLYTYPDVFVICGPPSYSSDPLPTVTNPLFIAEVLSASTRDYDRGLKFDLYRTIPTLRDYLLVDQYAIDVEHRFLDGARWEAKRYTNRADVVRPTGINAALPVDAIYDLVDFSPPPHNQ
ncbi:MAG: Uma2 family endonuclease [Acidobacteriota bacterium]